MAAAYAMRLPQSGRAFDPFALTAHRFPQIAAPLHIESPLAMREPSTQDIRARSNIRWRGRFIAQTGGDVLDTPLSHKANVPN